MARAPFKPVELDEALRPVAAPVDSFVQAQVPSRDTNLQDLARSLSTLGGSLASMVGQREKQAEQDDALRGEAAFHANNQQGFAEGVASGAIPAQASKAFVQAYKKAEGEVAGGVLEQKFAAAYNSWEGKSSTDPKAYDAFVGSFLKDNISTQDPDILRGLLPKIRQVTTNYLQQHIGDASKASMDGFTTALSARGDQAIDAANSAGLASKQGTDYGAVFDQLEAIREEGLKHGANEAQTDQKLIDTVTTAAVTKRDPRLLDFLDRKVPGKDYAWGNTPYGRDQRQKTIDTLETMGRKSIADEEKRNREEQKAAKDDITRRTIQAITKDPNSPIPEDLLAAGEKVDPDFRVNAIHWRDTIGKGTTTSDPREILGVTTEVLNGGGIQAVQKAMARGVFKNASDLTTAYKLAEQMTKDGPKIDAILKGGSAKTILDTIKKRTATSKDANKYFDDGSVSPEGLQGQLDFKLQALAWMQANPDANAIDQEKAINAIGADILKRITQPEFMGAIEFERGGLPTPNTFGATEPTKVIPSEKTAAPAAPQATARPVPFGGRDVTMPSELPGVHDQGSTPPAPPQTAPKAPTVQATPEQAGAWYNGLPPETKAALELKAAQEKKPLTLKVQEVFQKGIERGVIPAPAPLPVHPPSPASPVPTAEPPAGPSARVRELERQHSRPGAKRSMLDAITDPFGLLSNRPRAPWYPKKGPDGEAKDEKFGALRAPDGTPIETASMPADVESMGRAFKGAIDAPPTPDTVRLVGEAFERALAGTARPVGHYSAATLRDDPKAARILDFVAGPESGGNYNAYYGHGGSTRDLSTMTLDRVVDWSRSRGTASTATGRYQFMAETLKGLKAEMGLSGAERFTPELQDRMALQLLRRRGYDDFAAGRLSTAQFANRLAQEWAALPRFDTGRSHYDGDGLNRSLVSTTAVRNALEGGGAAPDAAGQRAGVRGMFDRLLGRGRSTQPPSTRV